MNSEGSTPLSRTVEVRVVPAVAAYPASAAVVDCDGVRWGHSSAKPFGNSFKYGNKSRWQKGSRYRQRKWVFLSSEGCRLDERNLVRSYQECAKGARLRKIRLHDLRHTFASQLIEQGGHPMYIPRTSRPFDHQCGDGYLWALVSESEPRSCGSTRHSGNWMGFGTPAAPSSGTETGAYRNPARSGAPGGTWTPNPQIRSLVLYPLSYGRVVWSICRLVSFTLFVLVGKW